MVNQRLEQLFRQQLLHKNSAEEKNELLVLMADLDNEDQVKGLLNTYWEEFDQADSKLEAVFQPGQGDDILNKLLEEHIYPTQIQDRKIKLWPRIAVAAAMVIAILGAGLFYFNSKNVYTADVKPGREGATLILASGKRIRLSETGNGELAKEAGVVITKSEDGQLVYQIASQDRNDDAKINTLSTANGETYQVRLPDGSLVYLNAASSLTYSAALVEHGKRVVKLRGEGYFEIAKDKKHPFVVKTDNQEVEVLGTHFNIMAYSNERAIATTLLEGAVKITSSGKESLLKPGEQALNEGGSIKISEADLENVTDWKDGDFYFERVDFRAVMRKIARWYDVEVIYDPSVPDNISSNGLISRNNKLSAVLTSIEKSGQVHFKIEGKKIYVFK